MIVLLAFAHPNNASNIFYILHPATSLLTEDELPEIFRRGLVRKMREREAREGYGKRTAIINYTIV